MKKSVRIREAAAAKAVDGILRAAWNRNTDIRHAKVPYSPAFWELANMQSGLFARRTMLRRFVVIIGTDKACSGLLKMYLATQLGSDHIARPHVDR